MQSKNPVFARRGEFTRGGYATFDAPGRQQQQYGQPPQGQQPGYGAPAGAVDYRHPGRGQQPPTGSSQQLDQWYSGPTAGPAQTGRMTYDDVVLRTGLLFAVLLGAAALTWFTVAPTALVLPVWIGSMLVGLVLGLVISFSKVVRPPLIVLYAAVQGVFLGSISYVFESFYDGIIFQAVLATLGAFAAMLVAYKTKVIRATPKFTRFLIIATIGYGVFALLNFAAVMLLGTTSVYQMGILGIGISLLGVGLASLNLILDFDYIDKGVQNGLPRQFAWVSAFGLMVTLVWLYIEMLRLISLLRGNN